MNNGLYIHGVTDIGQKRPTNQDQFLVAELSRELRLQASSHSKETASAPDASAKLLCVADGMGGHQAGRRASELAIEGVIDYFQRTSPYFLRDDVAGEDSFGRYMADSLHYCRTRLQEEARRNPENRGMGTTVTIALILWPRMYLAHAGDSRCYLLREGKLERLTRDHTLSQLYRESQDSRGVDVSEKEAERLNNTLWNVLSAGEGLEPEVGRFMLEDDDQILLCSDGLYKELSDRRIQGILLAPLEVATACQQLVNEANRLGGSDNITALLARRDQVPDAEKAAQLADTVDLQQPR